MILCRIFHFAIESISSPKNYKNKELARILLIKAADFHGSSDLSHFFNDAKAERKTQTLIVRQLTFEPQVSDYEGLLPMLADKLWSFAAFNNCEQIVVERVQPTKIERKLVQQLEQSKVSTL